MLVFEKTCMLNDCKTKKIKSKLEGELKLAILKNLRFNNNIFYPESEVMIPHFFVIENFEATHFKNYGRH